MKLKEIRLGNIVGRHGSGVPHLEIDKKVFMNLLEHEWYLATLYPISLTQKILEDNGFESYKDEENDSIIWSLGTFELYQEAWGDYIGDTFSYATRKRGDRFKSGFVVPYVHKLQNLYFETELKEMGLVNPLVIDNETSGDGAT